MLFCADNILQMRKSNIEYKLDKELQKEAQKQAAKISQLERLVYKDDNDVENNDEDC